MPQESTRCVECGELVRVPFEVLDALGGTYYCEDCRGKAPEKHPQSPEFEGEFAI